MRILGKATILVICLTIVLASLSMAAPRPYILWHQEARPTRVAAIKALVESFNEKNPDAKIVIENQSWNDARLKVIAALQAGNPPDFMFTVPDVVMNMHLLKGVQPVTKLMKSLAKQYKVYPNTMEPYYIDRNYYGIPLYGMDEVLWYRTDLFAKAGVTPPKTWSEWLAVCKKLVDSGVVKYPIAVAGDYHSATTQQIYPLMCVNKAETLIDGKGNVVFDNPRTVQAYEMYMKLFKFSPTGSEKWQWDQPLQAFQQGVVAMVMEKGHYIEQWELNTKLPADLMAAVPVPLPDSGGQRATYYGPNGIMMTTLDDDAALVFERFVRYLYEPETMGRLLAAAPGLFLPVTEEAAKSKSITESPAINKHKAKYDLLVAESVYGKVIGFTAKPYNPYVGRIIAQDIISLSAQPMIHQGMSAAEAVKQGAERMKRAMK